MNEKNYSWANAEAYERFMGRWSSKIARSFLSWLDVTPDQIWLDVGCGTGSFTKLILEIYNPRLVVSIDASYEFISFVKNKIINKAVRFEQCNAEALNPDSDSIDVTVSGLVLNFMSDPEKALGEMIRVTKPGGIIGIFLWDYSEGMQMLKYF